MFPGLDLYSMGTDPEQHLVTINAGPIVDFLYDLYELYDLL